MNAQPHRSCSGSGRRSGFTLVEVAAAVAILGLVCAGLLVARARAVQATGRAGRILTAVRLCQGRVADLKAGIAQPGSGPFPDDEGYTWSIVEEDPPHGAPPGLSAFTVTVSPPPGEAAEDRRAAEQVRATVWLLQRSSEEESP